MSKARWIGSAHGLLLNAACKRAWGESVEVFDPGLPRRGAAAGHHGRCRGGR